MEQSSSRLQNWLKIFWFETGMEYHYPEDFNRLLIAAFFDLSRILCRLFDENTYCDQAQKDLALFWAARMSSTAAVDVLLRHNANPNTRRVDRQTPLAISAHHGHVSVVRRLVA